MNGKMIQFAFMIALMITAATVGCGEKDQKQPIKPPEPTEPFEEIASIEVDVPEPSGLTLDCGGEALWVVSDRSGRIYKIDFEGNRIKRHKWRGEDLEAITQRFSDGHIFVAEERTMEIVELDSVENEIHRISMDGLSNDENAGIEGLAYDQENDLLLLVNEKNPCAFLALDCAGNEVRRYAFHHDGDASGICYDPETGGYWVVSDEAELLMAYDSEDVLIRARKMSIDKMEGIVATVDKLYIVSDSEKMLYIYPKKPFFEE